MRREHRTDLPVYESPCPAFYPILRQPHRLPDHPAGRVVCHGAGTERSRSPGRLLESIGAGFAVRAMGGAGSRRRFVFVSTLAQPTRVTAATLAVFGLTQLVTLSFSVLGWWFLDPGKIGRVRRAAGRSGRPQPRHRRYRYLAGLALLYVRHQWQRNVEAEARSRLRALQARIHPHFLFNTLNTIAGLIPGQPDQAEQAVLDLADLLRSALAHQERITLGEELELTRRFIAIERLRLGERLQVAWHLADGLPLAAPLPALLLQPLVENAIRHGIQPLPEGGRLTIRIERRSSALRFSIANLGGRGWRANQRIRAALGSGQYPPAFIAGFRRRLPVGDRGAPDRYQVAFRYRWAGSERLLDARALIGFGWRQFVASETDQRTDPLLPERPVRSGRWFPRFRRVRVELDPEPVESQGQRMELQVGLRMTEHLPHLFQIIIQCAQLLAGDNRLALDLRQPLLQCRQPVLVGIGGGQQWPQTLRVSPQRA